MCSAKELVALRITTKVNTIQVLYVMRGLYGKKALKVNLL
jgi:hypothetical protein